MGARVNSRSTGPQSIGAVLGKSSGAIDRIEALMIRQRERIESEILPGETFEQAKERFLRRGSGRSLNVISVHEEMERTKAGSSFRPRTQDDDQPDFLVPSRYELATKDNRGLMDIALFRLSKRDKRAGELIRYNLPDGYVEVSAGAHGMASVWDYDIVLMMVSHLTEAMNRYRNRKGEKPGRVFRPQIRDILKFARRGDGSRQVEEVESALDRLRDTTIKIVRENGKFRTTESEGLIARYRVLSRTDTKKISSVEIEAPEWIYREVIDCRKSDVLTVHPDYFLIAPGIGRYLYRLARRAAGKSTAKWAFRTIYERSGSTGTLKKFTENLRKVISANNLPEYTFMEKPGQSGPQLIMRHRSVQSDSPSP